MGYCFFCTVICAAVWYELRSYTAYLPSALLVLPPWIGKSAESTHSAELELNRSWPSRLYIELLSWLFFPSKIVWIGLNRPIHLSYRPSLTDSWLLKWFLIDSCCNDVTVIQLSFDFWIKRAIDDSSSRSTSIIITLKKRAPSINLHSIIIKFLLRNVIMFLYCLHSPL
jgi:hypothetical protein